MEPPKSERVTFGSVSIDWANVDVAMWCATILTSHIGYGWAWPCVCKPFGTLFLYFKGEFDQVFVSHSNRKEDIIEQENEETEDLLKSTKNTQAPTF